MANSSPKKLVQMLNLDSIFEEATTTATAEIDSRRRFEQLRLLDGLRDFVSGNVTLGDLLMTLEILEEKFSVSSDKIAAARRDYLFEYIFERVRSSGYQCEINPAF